MAIFTALVVILQVIAYYIKIGPISVTLVLIPIVVGAAMYGVGAGAFLGGVFGVVVLIGTISGIDPGAYILWSAKPLITALLCIVKGVAAGFLAGLVYSAIAKKRRYLGVIVAAIVCPVVNTGIFSFWRWYCFITIFSSSGGAGTSLIYFTLIGLTGTNFLLELGSNIVLSPAAVRIHQGRQRLIKI
jgi:uncharacterized membrane protein